MRHRHTGSSVYFDTNRPTKREDTEMISKLTLNMIKKCTLMLNLHCCADLWQSQSAEAKLWPCNSNNNWWSNKWSDQVTWRDTVSITGGCTGGRFSLPSKSKRKVCASWSSLSAACGQTTHDVRGDEVDKDRLTSLFLKKILKMWRDSSDTKLDIVVYTWTTVRLLPVMWNKQVSHECVIISYSISVGHERQVIIGYQYCLTDPFIQPVPNSQAFKLIFQPSKFTEQMDYPQQKEQSSLLSPKVL